MTIERKEPDIYDHEARLVKVEGKTKGLRTDFEELAKEVRDSSIRVDESNKFLREQNMKQSEQNTEILQAVLNRNDKTEERKHELRLIDKHNIWKLAAAIGGSAGTVVVLVQLILQAVKGGN